MRRRWATSAPPARWSEPQSLRLPVEPGILGLAGALGVAYSVYAVLRQVHFMTGLDLSIFDQAIWHLSKFQAPGSTIKGLHNLWGDHFHPILIVLAPFYWLWSDARVLLIAQALLVAVSVVTVFLFARSRLALLRRP